MLIYEKTIDGVRHLYGTLDNIPSDDDPQLVYKDATGKEIDNIAKFKLFYGTDKLMKASLQTLPTADDTDVNVYIGDVLIIGDGGEEPSEEPGIYFYDEETDEPYLAMTWAEVKETFSDAFVETEEGIKITGITSKSESYFATIEEPFKIVIHNEITSIGNDAFSGCTVASIIIPRSVTSIGNGVFYACTNLTTIVIPNSVITVGEWVFNSCYALESVTLPNSLTSIGSGAFSENASLENIDIPDNITTLPNNIFYGCLKFTDIVVPEGVTVIGQSAFNYCTSLVSITIPSTVNEIGEEALYSCSALTDINYNGTKAQWGDITFGDRWDSATDDYTVHCTDGDISKQ